MKLIFYLPVELLLLMESTVFVGQIPYYAAFRCEQTIDRTVKPLREAARQHNRDRKAAQTIILVKMGPIALLKPI